MRGGQSNDTVLCRESRTISLLTLCFHILFFDHILGYTCEHQFVVCISLSLFVKLFKCLWVYLACAGKCHILFRRRDAEAFFFSLFHSKFITFDFSHLSSTPFALHHPITTDDYHGWLELSSCPWHPQRYVETASYQVLIRNHNVEMTVHILCHLPHAI